MELDGSNSTDVANSPQSFVLFEQFESQLVLAMLEVSLGHAIGSLFLFEIDKAMPLDMCRQM
jgi:hypothetical protein